MGILQDAFEGEETEQSKRNRDFKAPEKCEKNRASWHASEVLVGH
jgi:hypothetical protein